MKYELTIFNSPKVMDNLKVANRAQKEYASNNSILGIKNAISLSCILITNIFKDINTQLLIQNK